MPVHDVLPRDTQRLLWQIARHDAVDPYHLMNEIGDVAARASADVTAQLWGVGRSGLIRS